jgi:hypothetical protein
LICVRYRYDEESRTRVKTVEIIVEKKHGHLHRGGLPTMCAFLCGLPTLRMS